MDVMIEVFDTSGTLLSEAYCSEWTKIVKDFCHSNVYMSCQNKPKEGPHGLTREAFYNCIHAHLLTVSLTTLLSRKDTTCSAA